MPVLSARLILTFLFLCPSQRSFYFQGCELKIRLHKDDHSKTPSRPSPFALRMCPCGLYRLIIGLLQFCTLYCLAGCIGGEF